MKTNQIMVRDDNRFIQRTKDGYFNATTLLNDWNAKDGSKKKLMYTYTKLKTTNEFIDQLKKENISDPIYISNKGTWMHPKLFIDFAMWVSVEFKSIVIDYVLDGLIKSRHDAGDYYNEMCAAIIIRYIDYYGRKPDATIYIKEAKLIKSLMGLETKDRNLMTEKELNSLTQMQKLNSLLISKGIGKDARIKQLELQSQLLKM